LTQDETKPLIEFPSVFPIKVMGEAHVDFIIIITTLIQEIKPTFDTNHIETRASSAGKYMSLTCNVHVASQDELDAIYRAISAHPLVKFAL